MIRGLLLTFIPLFVAVDVVAVVLVYLGIGVRLPEPARRRLILESTITAAAVGLGFLFAGDAILGFLGVTVGDFQIAGGLLLLVLLLRGTDERSIQVALGQNSQPEGEA